ncbi:MAG: hypothetical protein ACRD3T_14065 [Terriglobia bacterium]
MLSDRLIRTIETHAEELTRGALGDLQSSPHTPSYQKLSSGDLYQRVYKVYHDLGTWLSEKTDEAIQTCYLQLGEERFNQGVPLREVIWALTLTRYRLRDYIRSSGLANSALDLYQQMELHQLVSHFFDRAIYYTVAGYENAAAVRRDKGALAGHGVSWARRAMPGLRIGHGHQRE